MFTPQTKTEQVSSSRRERSRKIRPLNRFACPRLCAHGHPAGLEGQAIPSVSHLLCAHSYWRGAG